MVSLSILFNLRSTTPKELIYFLHRFQVLFYHRVPRNDHWRDRYWTIIESICPKFVGLTVIAHSRMTSESQELDDRDGIEGQMSPQR